MLAYRGYLHEQPITNSVGFAENDPRGRESFGKKKKKEQTLSELRVPAELVLVVLHTCTMYQSYLYSAE